MQQKEVLIIVGILLIGVLFLNRGGSMRSSDSATVTGNYIYPCYNPCKDVARKVIGPYNAYSSDCLYSKNNYCGECTVDYILDSERTPYPQVYAKIRKETYECYRSSAGLNQMNKLF